MTKVKCPSRSFRHGELGMLRERFLLRGKPRRKLLLLLASLLNFFLTVPAYAADHGVILLYHHVSSETPGITSVTPEQFEDHLEYLAENEFQVIPVVRDA